MKRIAALVVVTVILTCLGAFATSNPDPKIVIRDPVCGSGCTSVGRNFSFTSPVSGSGTLFFTNATASSWTKLKLVETGVLASDISCSAPHTFMNCSVATRNGVTTILLSGVGGKFTGIAAGHSFDIRFGTWPRGGVNFTAAANVPEPATLALFITGLGAIATRRRKWFSQN